MRIITFKNLAIIILFLLTNVSIFTYVTYSYQNSISDLKGNLETAFNENERIKKSLKIEMEEKIKTLQKKNLETALKENEKIKSSKIEMEEKIKTLQKKNLEENERIKKSLKIEMEEKIKTLQKKMDTPRFKKLNIGLIVTATNKYARFIKPMIESAEKYFLPHHNLHYFIFTDLPFEPSIANNTRLHKIHTVYKPWPDNTLKRYENYYNAIMRGDIPKDKVDYLYALDADAKIISLIGDEILGDWVSTTHVFLLY
jgi:hypothetical protein